MNEPSNSPTTLYKLISKEQWQESLQLGSLSLSSMDQAFIHLAKEDQVQGVAEKFWSDIPEYLILELDTTQLPGTMKYETNPGRSTKYYHLYNGSIPLAAVKKATVIKNT